MIEEKMESTVGLEVGTGLFFLNINPLSPFSADARLKYAGVV